MLANRMNGVSESATLKLNALVQTLKAQGVDVINLTAGEPDFNVHPQAKEAAMRAIESNQSRYTPAAGIPVLRELVAQKTNNQQPEIKNPWKPSHVVITNGGKQAIFNTLMALINPGDEVLIPSPYWLSYPEMVKICGGVSKIIDTNMDSGFKISPRQLEEALNAKTKCIILNSPSNPTGAMYSKAELAELGKVLEKSKFGKNFWVISDEIYDRIALGSIPFCSFLGAAPQLQDRVVTINGMSKSYAMTGWRIGWSVAPDEITGALITLQGQSTSGINSVAQVASVAALKIKDEEFQDQVDLYKKRAKIIVEGFVNLKKAKVFEPQGAFYCFVDLSSYFLKNENSFGFCERVLKEAQVCLVPGTHFGAEGHVRASFAVDEKSVLEGVKRLKNYLEP